LQRRLPVTGPTPDDGLLSSGLKHLSPVLRFHTSETKTHRGATSRTRLTECFLCESQSLHLSARTYSFPGRGPACVSMLPATYLLLSIPRTRAPPTSHLAISISQARGATSRHQTGETGTAATGMPAANRPPEARPQAPQNKGRGAQQARQETGPQIPIVQVFARQAHRLAAMQRMQPAQTALGSCWEPGACEPSGRA